MRWTLKLAEQSAALRVATSHPELPIQLSGPVQHASLVAGPAGRAGAVLSTGIFAVALAVPGNNYSHAAAATGTRHAQLAAGECAGVVLC